MPWKMLQSGYPTPSSCITLTRLLNGSIVTARLLLVGTFSSQSYRPVLCKLAARRMSLYLYSMSYFCPLLVMGFEDELECVGNG